MTNSVLLFAFFCAFGAAGSAPTAIAPPDLSTEYAQKLTPDVVNLVLTASPRTHVFDAFEGKNEVLRAAQAKGNARVVADGYSIELSGPELFDAPIFDGGANLFISSITSLDAHALRLKVDLSTLGPTDEAFVIDITEPRAFGPYTRDDGIAWLATTIGDTCMFVVRAQEPDAPFVSVSAVSHFYEDLELLRKELSCNNDIACENDPDIQESSTGVGMLIVPQGDFFQALCSGSLINNADTPAFEPYFLTSYHCVPDGANAADVEVLWDWRAATCGGNDPSIPSLPRSDGERLLRTSSTYDITLMELDDVPSGNLGRAYLGWETRDPIDDEDVVTIHFPGASPMKISYGNVIGIDQTSNGFIRQTKVHWDDGVTEGGSSGGPLLLVDDDYRIVGTLSNGPQHSCLSTGGNVDWYSSFRDFFPLIEDYLTGDDPPVDPGPIDPALCAAEKTFPENSIVLDGLRKLRDDGLSRTTLGTKFVDMYYRNTAALVWVVDHSPLARWTFRAVVLPLGLGSHLYYRSG